MLPILPNPVNPVNPVNLVLMIAAITAPTTLEVIGTILTGLLCFIGWHLLTSRLPLPRRRHRQSRRTRR
jgi:uncharacterized integral membrane protein